MSLYTNTSFNPILSEALNKIGENNFVGTKIFPVRNVGTKVGEYPIFGTDQFDNNSSKARAAGALFPRQDFEYNKQTYATVQYALEGVLPDEDETAASEAGVTDASAAIAQKLQRNLMVGHELRCAAALTGAGFTGTPATGKFDGTGAKTPTPIIDIQNAVERLNAHGFYDNIALIIETSLFNKMINTDDVRGIFNGNGTYTNRQVLLDAFGVNEIIITPTRYNGAAKGNTSTRERIWKTDELYVAQVAGGDFANGGFGRTLSFGPDGGLFTAEVYRDEPIKSDILRVYNSVDEVVINTHAGQKITGA